MGFSIASLADASGVNTKTLHRIERGKDPGHMAASALMLPLAYGPEVRDLLLDGPVDPDALDALAAPVDALNRLNVIPEPYRGRSLFFRRVGAGLPPHVRAGALVACVAGPHEDGTIGLVEFARRGLMAVRFARRRDDVWELREDPKGTPAEVLAVRVRRVSKVLFEARQVE